MYAMQKSANTRRNGVFVLIGLVAASVLYVLAQHFGSPSVASVTASQQSQPSSAVSTQVAQSSGRYASGTYTGSAASAYYGMVQVQAVIQNGKLSSVQFLQYPNTHNTSININQQAMPILQTEAIQAQSSNVNIVSGATFTSQAFQQSLSAALSQAQA
jgi:uncharacterized protein with FMN-binding domain